jgi:ribonuclease HI
MLGLLAVQNRGVKEVHLIMDSELVIRQLQGIYKVKDAELKILHKKIKDILSTFSKVQFSSVLREKNKLADELANQVMDDEFPIYAYKSETMQSSFFE